MTTPIKIGLWDEAGNLIGYKTDSFWNLSKNPANAKKDFLDRDGKLRANLIRNLRFVIGIPQEEAVAEAPVVGGMQLVNTLAASRGAARKVAEEFSAAVRQKYYEHFETMLVGYLTEGAELPVYTHRVFPDAIEELTPEESKQTNV